MDNIVDSIMQSVSDSVVLPNSNMSNEEEKSNSELISVGIEKAIQKEVVGKVLVRENTSINIPSYLIDMTEVGDIMPCTLVAMKNMMNSNGDTTIYVKKGDNINEIGRGDSEVLYNQLDVYINAVFDNKCKIYKNTGNGFNEVKAFDVDNIKLDI